MSKNPPWWPTAEDKRHADAGCAHPDECRIAYCINCGQAMPHVGTSWKESGACRRNEAAHNG